MEHSGGHGSRDGLSRGRAGRARFGWPGWTAAGLLAACVAGKATMADEPAWSGALAWSAYVLLADSAVFSLRGASLLRTRPDCFCWLAVLSIFLWLPFEWYNLQLAVWYRSGLPPGLGRYLVLGWSFACVWPALLETSDLLAAGFSRGCSRSEVSEGIPTRRTAWAATAAGSALLVVPLAVPRLDVGEHLMPLVPAGLLLLLDPWNSLRGRPGGGSVEWEGAARRPPWTLAVAAVVCGTLAAALNALGPARWHSLWSLGAEWRLAGLPVAAYAVLPLLGLCAHAMHAWASARTGIPAACSGSVLWPRGR